MAGTKQLDKLPIFSPFVNTYRVHKTDKGVSEEQDPTLKRYYSSIDAEIYFGNEYVEDVSDINFVIDQHTQPIFGFNSYTADAISQGSRTISGSFAIRFTSPNYLFKLLDAAKEESVTNMKYYILPDHERSEIAVEGRINEELLKGIEMPKNGPIWPQTFDIDIALGGPSYAGGAQHYILTGVKILNCTTGASSSSPVPVTEVYNFIATDIKTDAQVT